MQDQTKILMKCKIIKMRIMNCAVPENIHTHPMEGQRNTEGVGGLKIQNFKQKVWGLTGISRGVGGFKPINLLWEGYGYFLEQHIMRKN